MKQEYFFGGDNRDLRHYRIMAMLLIGCLFLPSASYSAESENDLGARPLIFAQTKNFEATPEPTNAPKETRAFSTLSLEDRNFRTGALIFGSLGGVLAYGKTTWWKDGFSGNFKTVNEGWFGQNTYAGGADKMGHAYSTYVGVAVGRGEFADPQSRGVEWQRERAATCLVHGCPQPRSRRQAK